MIIRFLKTKQRNLNYEEKAQQKILEYNELIKQYSVWIYPEFESFGSAFNIIISGILNWYLIGFVNGSRFLIYIVYRLKCHNYYCHSYCEDIFLQLLPIFQFIKKIKQQMQKTRWIRTIFIADDMFYEHHFNQR